MWNADGERYWVKFHFKTRQGHKHHTNREAEQIIAKSRESYQEALYGGIEKGDFPQWDVFIQAMPDGEDVDFEAKTGWSAFDLTKVWPHATYPLIRVGVMELNRNPDNYFAEIEQAAFKPVERRAGHRLLARTRCCRARLFSYPDAHRYRIGTHYEALEVNRRRGHYHNGRHDAVLRQERQSGRLLRAELLRGPKEDKSVEEPPLGSAMRRATTIGSATTRQRFPRASVTERRSRASGLPRESHFRRRVPVMTPVTAAGLAVAALLAGTAACAQSGAPVAQGPPNVPAFHPAFPEQTRAPATSSGVTLAVETVGRGLEHPWGSRSCPTARMLVTERPGRLRVVAADGALSEPVAGVPEVVAAARAGCSTSRSGRTSPSDRHGLLDLRQADGEGAPPPRPRAAGWRRTASQLTEVAGHLRPAAAVADRPTTTARASSSTARATLFVTTGEHFSERERAARAGPRARPTARWCASNLDGSVPEDNPFVGRDGAIPSIWSYGHRNIQAAALDADGPALDRSSTGRRAATS